LYLENRRAGMRSRIHAASMAPLGVRLRPTTNFRAVKCIGTRQRTDLRRRRPLAAGTAQPPALVAGTSKRSPASLASPARKRRLPFALGAPALGKESACRSSARAKTDNEPISGNANVQRNRVVTACRIRSPANRGPIPTGSTILR
jgi:hypothetical protein